MMGVCANLYIEAMYLNMQSTKCRDYTYYTELSFKPATENIIAHLSVTICNYFDLF